MIDEIIDGIKEEPSGFEEAKERFEHARSAWGKVYEKAREDQEFYAGTQWEGDVETTRAGRPSLVTSHLQQFVHHVTNTIRKNMPAIKVAPVDDTTDIARAKIVQGLIKSCEQISSADIAYQEASENSIVSSFGFIRLDHDYATPDTFEQHILVRPTVNPLSVYIDPASVMPDGSDAKYGFVSDIISEDEFDARYPDKEASSFDGDMVGEGMVRIVEYFFLEPKSVEIGLLPDGTVLELDEIAKLNGEDPSRNLKPVKTRMIEKNIVRRQKLSGSEILEESMFPGSYIPIVPVYGEVRWVNGERQVWSLIRNAKDSQRMINYYNSLMVESLSKGPQAPFMGLAGQFEGFEADWKNTQRAMVLQYNHVDLNGVPAPAPQRMQPPPMPSGAYEAKQQAIMEMRAAMGLNDSNLGQPDNATSGLAIDRRQRQGETSVAHFSDNLSRSIAHVGRIFLSMMPEIYDTPRMVRVLNPEDEALKVQIGSGTLFDINAGKYDISVEAGPSFSTRREETYQMMLQIIQTNPALMGVIGDLIFKYSDTPGADVISERLRKTIPPQLLEGENKQPGGQDQQSQQQLQMMSQKIEEDQALIQQATVKVQEMQQELEQCKAQLSNKADDLQVKARSDQLKNQTEQMKLQLEARKLDLEEQKLQIEAARAHHEMTMPSPMMEQQMPKEMGIKLDTTGFQMMKTPEQLQSEQAQSDQDAQQEMVDTQLKMQELQIMQEDMARRSQEQAALMQGIGGIQQAVGALISEIQKPKQVLRDENGMIKGVA